LIPYLLEDTLLVYFIPLLRVMMCISCCK